MATYFAFVFVLLVSPMAALRLGDWTDPAESDWAFEVAKTERELVERPSDEAAEQRLKQLQEGEAAYEERQRLEKERLENERLEKERLEKERLENEQLEKEDDA